MAPPKPTYSTGVFLLLSHPDVNSWLLTFGFQLHNVIPGYPKPDTEAMEPSYELVHTQMKTQEWDNSKVIRAVAARPPRAVQTFQEGSCRLSRKVRAIDRNTHGVSTAPARNCSENSHPATGRPLWAQLQQHRPAGAVFRSCVCYTESRVPKNNEPLSLAEQRGEEGGCVRKHKRDVF